MMRSPLALTPGPGQRSVWDFPRPPAIETVSDRVLVEFGGGIIADTIRAVRVCETASPPAYYLPFADVAPGVLIPCPGGSFCEWKGRARYWSVVTPSREEKRAAWSYSNPTDAFAALADHVAFYAGRLDRCRVGRHLVVPQPGGFYGGWITPEFTGPFKGEPGTTHW
jgi:uncharacterized protein (DUF427 family)